MSFSNPWADLQNGPLSKVFLLCLLCAQPCAGCQTGSRAKPGSSGALRSSSLVQVGEERHRKAEGETSPSRFTTGFMPGGKGVTSPQNIFLPMGHTVLNGTENSLLTP